MGVYGYPENITPFLDSLFKKGVVFENAITPGYLTFQTDAAILSGLYPSENNVRQWTTPIDPKLDLLPRILGYYGYKTTAFLSPSLWPNFGFDKQFDSYKLYQNPKNLSVSKVDVANWMNKTFGPFFLFWHIYDAHSPYLKQNSVFYSGNYRGIFTQPISWFWEGQSKTEFVERAGADAGSRHHVTAADVDYLKGSYDSGLRYVDDQLKQFFDSIKNEPWYKTTIFIISAEHGEDLKEHGYIFHRDLYDVNTRVPLAIVAPGWAAKKITEAVSSLDIMPTIIDFAGGAVPGNVSGQDLLPVIRGTAEPRDIFTERPPFDEYSVRRGNWKYILRNPQKLADLSGYDEWMKRLVKMDDTFGDELYNLKDDPREQNNLLGKGLQIEGELRAVAENFREKMRRARVNGQNFGAITPVGGIYIPYP